MLRGAGSLKEMQGSWWVSAEEQFTLVQIPNSHSLELKTVNNTVVEISLSFYEALNSRCLKLSCGRFVNYTVHVQDAITAVDMVVFFFL